MTAPASHLFIAQDTYVDARLIAAQLRLQMVVAAAARGDEPNFAPLEGEELDIYCSARESAARGVEMPLLWLRERLHLTTTEESVIWLLLAHELDPSSRQFMRELNTEKVVDATLDAIRRAVYGSRRKTRAGAELGADGPLRRLGLIERTDEEERCPEHRQTFAVSRRVLALALGNIGIDPELASIASLPSQTPACAELVVSPEPVEQLVRIFRAEPTMVLLTGRVGTGRRSLLVEIARQHKLEVLQINGRAIANDRTIAARQLRNIDRECRLLGRIPLICHLDALTGVGEVSDRIDLIESELGGLVLATTSRPIARRWVRAPTLITMPSPTTRERTRLWARAIPEASQEDAALMATMYPLAAALIIAAGEVAHRQAGAGVMSAVHITAGIRSVLDDRLAGLATRITVTQSWDDLVLPTDQATALVELMARIRQRSTVYEAWGFGDKVGKGLGVSALFSGPPGTGKTMAAGLVANDLGVELYQVDLSKIVSKWIGETERNLASLFDAAEAGHAILLFDEADALFGKRTDVKSSNDRHANQEVNFLLQRMESFTGVCLLTTNHESAIDEAFRRRLSLHVRFPVPDVEERRHLWHTLLPKNAPIAGDLDFDVLAESFAMSGGYIRNAMLRAAFLAADSTGAIDAELLARAAQLEYEAMGKIAPSSGFSQPKHVS